LLLEPVQVLQAVWHAEIKENYNLSFVEKFQVKFGHRNSQRKPYLGFPGSYDILAA